MANQMQQVNIFHGCDSLLIPSSANSFSSSIPSFDSTLFDLLLLILFLLVLVVVLSSDRLLDYSMASLINTLFIDLEWTLQTLLFIHTKCKHYQ
jgi:hypothetical protein